jgi:hypothetical protein
MNRKLAFILVSLVLLSVLSAGCAPTTESAPPVGTQQVQQFVGTVEGSNAFIGIATQENRILAYVCDGTLEQAPTTYAWFKGEVSGNSFDLTSEDGLHLTGQLESNTANGRVQFADGSEHAFAADLARPPAGLFRLEQTVEANQIISGWIVLANREFRGGNKMSGDGSLGKIDSALVTMDAQNLALP